MILTASLDLARGSIDLHITLPREFQQKPRRDRFAYHLAANLFLRALRKRFLGHLAEKGLEGHMRQELYRMGQRYSQMCGENIEVRLHALPWA